eukprot:XP_014631820.1 auxin response factor 2-like [Glycine max]
MPRQPPPSPPSQPGVLDPEIWRVCSGTTVEIPTLHSRVYYFPQGHFDVYLSAAELPGGPAGAEPPRHRRARLRLGVPPHLPRDAAAAPADHRLEHVREQQEARRRRRRGFHEELQGRVARRNSPHHALLSWEGWRCRNEDQGG